MTETFNYRQLKEEYGFSVLGLVRRYEDISRTKGRYQSHLRFYMQCKNQEMVPKGLKIKCQLQNAEARKIVEKAEKALLNIRISEVVKKNKILQYREEKAVEELNKEIPEGIVEKLKKINEVRRRRRTRTTKKQKNPRKEEERFQSRGQRNKPTTHRRRNRIFGTCCM